MIQKHSSPFSHRNWRRRRGRERRRGRSWNGSDGIETRIGRESVSDGTGTGTGRRTARGNGREKENERGKETVSAPTKSVKEREKESGRETEAAIRAKIEADPGKRVT